MRLTVDMRKAETAFAAGVNAMAKLNGLDRQKIVFAEVGSVLKACAGDTKEANLSAVEKGAVLRAFHGSGLTRGGQFTVNAGIKKGAPFGRVFMMKRGGSGYRRTHDADFATLNQHYRNPDWLALRQTVELAKEKARRAMARAPESVALARGSWVLIADSLGIKLEEVPGGRISSSAIQRARLARARRDLQKNNGASVLQKSAHQFFVTIINRYPAGSRLGFERLVAIKIEGRAKFFLTAIRKGFDGSLAQTAKLFPGWIVKPGSSN